MDNRDTLEKDPVSEQVEHSSTWKSTEEAREASALEHATTVRQALKDNWKAVIWSAVISMAIVMEGYDTALMSSFFGYPAFQKKFGHYYQGVGYQLSSEWQAGLTNGTEVGVIFGGFLNGWASSRYGYRKTILVGLFFMNAFLFITFFAPSAPVLLIGQLTCGLTWGIFATTGPSYASEVCPLALRGYLTVFVNLCWAIGQLIASGILQGLIDIPNEWAYRIPFAIQWVWPLPLFLAILWAPESPWWLLRQDRVSDAEKSLKRLSTRPVHEIRATMAQMVHTIQIENEIESGSTYWDCFKGVNLRRTEVCCMTFAGQMLSGAMFAYGPSYFFEQAGMSDNDAYKVGIGSTSLAFLGTISSWFLLTHFGRRTIYISGLFAMTVTLLIIGIVSVSSTSQGALWAQASLCLLWQLWYSLSVGPICYAIISETSAVRLRAKTVVLSRNTYNVVYIVAAVLEPYMMNPTEWNMKGKTAYVWAFTAACATCWSYFRLPECKGRTYEELDLLFARGVPARQFKDYEINAYEDHVE